MGSKDMRIVRTHGSLVTAKLFGVLTAFWIVCDGSQLSAEGTDPSITVPRWTDELPGPLERLGFDITIRAEVDVLRFVSENVIEDRLLAHMRQQLNDVKPPIEIQRYSEMVLKGFEGTPGKGITAHAFYRVTLSRKSSGEPAAEIIIGTMQVQLHIPGVRARPLPDFPSVELFVSAPDRASLTNAIEEVVRVHIDRILMPPIKVDSQ